MDTRLGWLAALGGLALVMARMEALLASGTEAIEWQLILIASVVLGGATTAGVLLAGARTWMLIPVNLLGAALALARTAAGSTLMLGVIPTPSSLALLSEEVLVALELIRFGAAPVLAVTGLVGALASVFWLLSGVVTFGGAKRRPMLMVVPIVGFYLVLATLDRSPARWWWSAGLAFVGVLGLLAGRGKRASGRARSTDSGRIIPAFGRALPTAIVTTVVVAAVLATGAFAATVPESGMVRWRNTTGFGGGLFGGVSYNLFTSMQQDLVGNDSTVVFVARVSEASPPNEDLYWKLITLDNFDGEFWLPANFAVNRPSGDENWEADAFAFVGPTLRAEQVVRIMGLRQNYLPHLYSPVALDTDNELLAESYRAREDGSIKFDGRTIEGLTYRITSDIPQPDLSVLASAGGRLSPIFQGAAAAGEIAIAPSTTQAPLPPERVRDDYTRLPDDLPSAIEDLAEAVTDRASTNFERALLLEAFFRSSGLFVYDASASTGHSTLDLASWLTEPESRNYRTGYCEQFASAMAVMARVVGIPSRIVMGFAPGEQVTQEDGSELVLVRARNAHAWVELYFGGQGWVRFDPTPRADGINPSTVSDLEFNPQVYLPEPTEPGEGSPIGPPPPLRPGEELLEPGDDPTVGLPSQQTQGLPDWITVFLVLVGLLAIAPAMKMVRRRHRLRRVEAGDLTAGWAEITDRLRDLGHTLDPSRTPRELAVAIDRGLLPLASRLGASIYGGFVAEDRTAVFRDAEERVHDKHRGWQWWQSWIQPRSLIRRGPLDGDGLSARRPAVLR
ncbi:MAG: DUF3488 and transglutaminase-like domain-containing protein [Acidimicrobiia bacterium]|nr:DUF3488 and transglutaminase-like domain-containing protein [Acidimicrobiia bacterium]